MTITRIQYKRGTSNQTSTITVVLDNAPTVGNTLIAAIGNASDGGDCHVTSISQIGVNWSKIKSSANYPSIVVESEIWLGNVFSSASTTITVNLSQALYYHVCNVCEYSGLLSSPLDKTASNIGYGNTVDSGTTATTSQANELWVGCLAGGSGSAGLSNVTNGFTMLDGVRFISLSVGFCEKIVSTTGSANVSATTAYSPPWAGCIATFKEGTTGFQDLDVGNLTVHQNAAVAGTLAVNGNSNCNGNLQFPVSGSSITFASSTGGVTGTNTGAIEFKDTYNNKKMRILGNYDTDGKYKIKSDYFNGSNWNLLSALTQDGQLHLPVPGSSGGLLIGGDVSLYREATVNTLKTNASCLVAGNMETVNMKITGTLEIDQWTKHNFDVVCYGFYGTDTDPDKQAGGGAIMMGSAFTSPSTPPELNLTDAQLDIPPYSSEPPPRRVRDVYRNTSNSTYYVYSNAPSGTWRAFQGPTSSRPTTACTGQFYIDTTTHKILINTNTAPGWNTAHWDDTAEGYESELGPYMGDTFSGFDTVFLLKGSPKNGDGTHQNKTANKTANLYLGNLYATGTIYYHGGAPTSFDSMDDLAVLKEIKSITDDKGNEIIDPETLNHLRSEGGFYDSAKMAGWNICVEKRLLERIEKLEKQLSNIIKGAEN